MKNTLLTALILIGAWNCYAQYGLIYHGTTGRNGDAAGFQFEPVFNRPGLIVENDNSESSGIFMNSEYVVIWSPGDQSRLVRFADEDPMHDWYTGQKNNIAYAETGYIDNQGFYKQSDSTRKENIVGLKSALQKITRLHGYSYNYKCTARDSTKEASPMRKTCGFMGQELERVIPDVVQRNEAGYLFVNYEAVIPYLVEAIKEQQVQINALRRKVNRVDPGRVDPSRVDPAQDARKADDVKGKKRGTTEHKLYQNAPNPFEVESVIKYELAGEVSSAHIMVFKMDGGLLNTYALDATSGELTIQAGEYTPGMYYYSLLVDSEEVDTKRMIITK